MALPQVKKTANGAAWQLEVDGVKVAGPFPTRAAAREARTAPAAAPRIPTPRDVMDRLAARAPAPVLLATRRPAGVSIADRLDPAAVEALARLSA